MRLSPPELRDLADAIERYCYYVEVGISNKNIAPFRQSWVETVLCLLPPSKPTHLSNEFYQQLLEEAIDEMKADYAYSMHKAIMHYIVRSPVERRCALFFRESDHASFMVSLSACITSSTHTLL
jgi:hypothetical protein